LPAFVCAACGTHYPVSDTPPDACLLCADPRETVLDRAQAWTTVPALRHGQFMTFRRLEPGLMGIGTEPGLVAGQRALLLRTTQGNILWDCPPFLDDATTTIVGALGGIAAIALSSPRGHGAMVDWSHAFDSAPVYVHASDRGFVARHDASVSFWEGQAFELLPGVTVIRCGGPFDGASVLHWAQGAGGQGVLMVGDTLRIYPDRNIGFMRSHANGVPLDPDSVLAIGELLGELPFASMYGSRWDRVIPSQARAVLARSVRRHVDAVATTDSL
jgi:hypothetical protein